MTLPITTGTGLALLRILPARFSEMKCAASTSALQLWMRPELTVRVSESSVNRESWSERFGSLRVWEQKGSFFRAPFPVPCHVCHKPTVLIDMDYEAAFCSEECLQGFETRLPQRGDSDAGQT